MSRLAILLIGAALVLPASFARAGLFDDEEARRQIKELRTELMQTVEAFGRRTDSVKQNQLDSANQAEALRADVARLTGQIEVLTNSLEAAHKRQQDFYIDLDNRLRKLESAAETPSVAASLSPAMPKPDPQAEMRDYEAALGHFRVSRFKEAQAAFENFAVSHAKSSLLPNAHYWLGSSLYQQKQYLKAATAFSLVATTWPNDPKAPDALLAQANALSETKDAKDAGAAIKVLETLLDKYPASPAAATARTRLQALLQTSAAKKKR